MMEPAVRADCSANLVDLCHFCFEYYEAVQSMVWHC